MTTSRTALIALAAAVSLGVTACGSDTGADGAGSTTSSSAAPSTTTTESSSDSPSDDSSSADDTSNSSTSAAGGASTDDVLAAISAAEEEAGGTAYEIDDQDDDGSWEIDVAEGSTSTEVTVTADGTATVDDDTDDLDDEDRAALQTAKISLGDAITTALKQVDGTLDDAELEEQGGRHVWQVTIDTTDRGGVEVDVDVESGQATVATDDDSDD